MKITRFLGVIMLWICASFAAPAKQNVDSAIGTFDLLLEVGHANPKTHAWEIFSSKLPSPAIDGHNIFLMCGVRYLGADPILTTNLAVTQLLFVQSQVMSILWHQLSGSMTMSVPVTGSRGRALR